MGLILLIAFIATPIVEITIFIGAGLLRWQGMVTWRRAAESLQRGVFPVNEVFTGLCLIGAGTLLLTPGFLTDAIGFALFVPSVQQLIAHLTKKAIERGHGPKVWVNGQPMDPRERVIDGEYETQKKPAPPDLELPTGSPNPNSPWNKRPDNPNLTWSTARHALIRVFATLNLPRLASARHAQQRRQSMKWASAN